MLKSIFLLVTGLLFTALSVQATSLPTDGPPWDKVPESESLEAAMESDKVPEVYEALAWSTSIGLSEEEVGLVDCSDGGGFSKGCMVTTKYTEGDWTFLIVCFSSGYEIRKSLAIMNSDGVIVDAFEYERSHENRYGSTVAETMILSEEETFQFVKTSTSKTYDEEGNVIEEESEMTSYTFDPETGELDKMKF